MQFFCITVYKPGTPRCTTGLCRPGHINCNVFADNKLHSTESILISNVEEGDYAVITIYYRCCCGLHRRFCWLHASSASERRNVGFDGQSSEWRGHIRSLSRSEQLHWLIILCFLLLLLLFYHVFVRCPPFCTPLPCKIIHHNMLHSSVSLICSVDQHWLFGGATYHVYRQNIFRCSATNLEQFARRHSFAHIVSCHLNTNICQ